MKNSPAHPPYMTKLEIWSCSFSAGRMHWRGSETYTDPVIKPIPVVSLRQTVKLVNPSLHSVSTPKQAHTVHCYQYPNVMNTSSTSLTKNVQNLHSRGLQRPLLKCLSCSRCPPHLLPTRASTTPGAPHTFLQWYSGP